MAQETNEADARYSVRNPRTGECLYEVVEPEVAQVDAAYGRAHAAFERLRRMSVGERLAELDKLKRYLVANKEKVARRISEETGKSLMDAMTLDVFPVCDAIAYYQKRAERILADKKVSTPLMLFGKRSRIVYDPIGPVLVISPWNYPFNLSMVPCICAFIAGNPVLLKPSKQTPLKGVVEDLVEGSGFFENGLQVLYASRRTARRLIEKRPAKIHFTGSVEVGRKIMAQAAEFLIPVELELGGKDPCIVFGDVHLERAVNGVLWGAFCNCGQTCTSVERVFVQENIQDAFLAMLKDKAEKIVTLAQDTGREDELSLTMGCMTADFQVAEIERQLDEARERGARVLTGGVRERGSHILPPTIVTSVDNSMSLERLETFGPVVTVTAFKTEEDAIRMANDSPYGLSSSVWSADLERAGRVARQLAAGSVSINNVMATHGNPALPFGGVKGSGFGRYRGAEGLYAFSNVKALLIDRDSRLIEPYWFPYSPDKYRLITRIMDTLFSNGALALLRTIGNAVKLMWFAQRHRL